MTGADVATQPVGTQRRGAALALPVAAVVVGVAFLVGLGGWQLLRLAEKEALIARVAAGLSAAPVPAPGPEAWHDLTGSAIDYRPVVVSGRFDHAHEVHVYGSSSGSKGPAPGAGYSGSGYFVLTPLETAAGWMVIVNRGFVPADRKTPDSRAAGQLAGSVVVAGVARQADHGNFVTPKADLGKNVWFKRDPAAIAAALGLPAGQVAPYIIDARFDPDLPGGLPQGGETVVSFPNNHLQYALTWFGLAAALLGVAIAALRRWLAAGRQPPEGGRPSGAPGG